jgi:hypothetical protein
MAKKRVKKLIPRIQRDMRAGLISEERGAQLIGVARSQGVETPTFSRAAERKIAQESTAHARRKPRKK